MLFRSVSFRFELSRFVLFRFYFFVSFLSVSFRFDSIFSFSFDLFHFGPFPFCFVSHFTGTHLNMIIRYLYPSFKWVRIVPLFSPSSVCIHTKRNSHRLFSLTGTKQFASRFNLTHMCIDDELSINNPEFENYLGQMYNAELEIKDTTESTTSASYLDLQLSIGRDGHLHTSIYDNRDDINFHAKNVPLLSSNIPSPPVYDVCIFQLIQYARACSSYECFILTARRFSSKLLKQGYFLEGLKSSFRKFYGRYGDSLFSNMKSHSHEC